MSRAFVKESDEGEPLPEIPLSPHPNHVTAHGLALLRDAHRQALAQREQLKTEKSVESESSLASLAPRIRWLEARLASARPVDLATQPRDRVAFGARVTVALEDGSEERWQIVGEDEADAGRKLVSWVSPLARALIGEQVGDEVLWQRPAGDVAIEIVAIDYGD